MSKKVVFSAVFILALIVAGQAMAHTPLCSCYEADGTITCEGGFSDGSSAAGVGIRVAGPDDKVLVEGKMDEFSEFSFEKPSGPYKVFFDAGPGHVVEINGQDIAE